MGALDEISSRCRCIVADGGRDVEGIIREAYDLEVYDWLKWELLQAVYNPSDLMTDEIEEGDINYCISELHDEVQDMVEEREEEEERDEMLGELDIDYDKSLGFYGDDMKIQGLFDFLLRSDEFREKFKRFSAIISSADEADHMTDVVGALREAASSEMKRHIDTWQAAGKIYKGYTYGKWTESFDGIAEFIADRPDHYNRYMADALSYYE